MGNPLVAAQGGSVATSDRLLEDRSVGPDDRPDESRGLRSGHSIPIGDRQSAHREAASLCAEHV